MIITPDFVFINNPRTGTTFARKAIIAAYASAEGGCAGSLPVREILLPIHRGRGQSGRDHHGTYAQIPREYASLPVASAVRNPFTLLAANYELGLWRPKQVPRDPTGELDQYKKDSFEYFIRVQELNMLRRWGVAFGRTGLGPLSAHHLRMFARRPKEAMAAVAAGVPDDEVAQHIGSITFLRQEHLADDLCKFMSKAGSRAALEAVRNHPPSHVTRRSREWSPASFTQQIANRIRQRDDYLFRTLARVGIDYSFSNADFSQRQRRDDNRRAV